MVIVPAASDLSLAMSTPVTTTVQHATESTTASSTDDTTAAAATVSDDVSNADACAVDESSITADDPGERFDVVDENNNVVRTATRGECHDSGLLHRSTHLFLFRTGLRISLRPTAPIPEVLLQRRAKHKKVGGGLWDLSVAEHLSAGESYEQATLRGSKEELGIELKDDDIIQVRSEAYLSKQSYPEANVLDYMFTSTFGALYVRERMGDVVCQEEEVEETQWWPVDMLLRRAKKEPEQFTRWLLIELRTLRLDDIGKMLTGEA